LAAPKPPGKTTAAVSLAAKRLLSGSTAPRAIRADSTRTFLS
jgi:hypothetical protein